MKKCFALLLALVTALAAATTAWATVTPAEPVTPSVTVEDQTYTDITSVPIAKLYQLVNEGTVSPAETFHFTITPESVTDASITDASAMPMFEPAAFDIAFTGGEATVDGASQSAELMLPTYTSVGIYTYKITETAGATAGVTYNTQPLYLKVTVLQADNSDGKVRVAAVHLGTEDGSKTAGIVNTYAAGALDVTKTVAGLLGDRGKDFQFQVVLTREQGKLIASDIGLTVAGAPQTMPAWDEDGTCTLTFTLKHGQTATISNLPYGTAYAVTEADYTAEGYAASKTGDTGTIAAAQATAAFTNTKNGTIDNGVLLDSVPYMVLLVIAAAGGVLLTLRRRGNRS